MGLVGGHVVVQFGHALGLYESLLLGIGLQRLLVGAVGGGPQGEAQRVVVVLQRQVPVGLGPVPLPDIGSEVAVVQLGAAHAQIHLQAAEVVGVLALYGAERGGHAVIMPLAHLVGEEVGLAQVVHVQLGH